MAENHNDSEDIEYINIDLDDTDDTVKNSMDILIEEDTDNSSDAAGTGRTTGIGVLREIFSYVIILAIAVVAAFAINRFVLLNAHVPSTSMVPTINVDDRLIGFRLAYLFSEPERGDIIMFKYPDDESQIFIKRIIGVPGDTAEIKDDQLYINSELIEEGYIAEPMMGNYGPYDVPDDSYFVMGDNRNVSDDARFWNNTYVARNKILAKALFRYYPSIKSLK